MKVFKSKIVAVLAALLFVALLLAYGVNKWVLKGDTEHQLPRTGIVKEPDFILEGKLNFLNEANELINTIDIEIADNDPERMRGLMYRSVLSDQQGMLFIFDEEEDQSFWMKNTKISLDILYVNEAMEIVTIYKHTQPFSESPIPSFEPAKYVVEVRAGFCDKYGIGEGDQISFAPI